VLALSISLSLPAYSECLSCEWLYADSRQTFDILLAEALTGEFSSIVSANSGYQWSMNYILNEAGQDIARLGVSAVPLPAAGWLLLSGFALLAGIGRRRSTG
jgi:hypothetical protein